ncbi:MAG TPA: DUF1028 domain-containing protein [Bradyrhizobium sp.]|nr:DUF1028 domain-containing protein [Bradyrhizobium sp.]
MTWSIVARDRQSGALGVAAASRFFAVGARVPFVASAGAIATQALVNPYYGIDGLALLRHGHEPLEIIDMLTRHDPGAAHRQMHLVNREGRTAAHTGRCCLDACGHLCEDEVSVAGNMLASPSVLSETLRTWHDQSGVAFPRRLIAAMQAGEAAGGDRRGKQSACLAIFEADEWSSLDLRVDDHAEPLAELERLEQVSRQEWTIYRRFVPTRSNPQGVTDHAVIDAATGQQGEQV